MQLKFAGMDTLSTLESRKRGRLEKLGDELDNEVNSYIKDLRNAGSPINTSMVISPGQGLLSAFGGSNDQTKEWARSLLDRVDYNKRKATVAGVSLD